MGACTPCSNVQRAGSCTVQAAAAATAAAAAAAMAQSSGALALWPPLPPTQLLLTAAELPLLLQARVRTRRQRAKRASAWC